MITHGHAVSIIECGRPSKRLDKFSRIARLCESIDYRPWYELTIDELMGVSLGKEKQFLINLRSKLIEMEHPISKCKLSWKRTLF
jgi:hypothetical protein